MALKHPHLTLGMPVPVGRRIGEAGKIGWMIFVGTALVACLGTYIFVVNASAKKGDELRAQETKLERLKETVSVLESQTAEMQSIHALESQISELGYVPVEQVQFIDAARGIAMK
jgi:hypothetical protein